ncbi:hypothetical protein [Paraburkholderia flava]|uniref:hypothetical protein n=1 Tax=Paraburkholderia flava TaxID=2547393 RepID=UPI00105B45F3|nr:hypothetical protein [Paraburkholderia flava]
MESVPSAPDGRPAAAASVLRQRVMHRSFAEEDRFDKSADPAVGALQGQPETFDVEPGVYSR